VAKSSSDSELFTQDASVFPWQAPSLSGVEAPEANLQPPTAEEIEAIQRQAWNEGYEQGRHEGLEAAERESLERIQALDRILEEMARPLDELDDRIEEELLALAMAVARQLIRRELKTDPGQIIGVIREGVRMLPSASGQIRLELHPEDARLVRERLDLGGEESRSWRIQEDPTLSRGGCRILNDTSRIDATVENRINQVVAAVLGGERVEDRS